MQIPEEQQVAIDIFNATGETQSFARDGINYVISQDPEGGQAIISAWDGKEGVGDCFTDSGGNHYGIGVSSQYRKKGIGSVLYSVKQEIDGVLGMEIASNASLVNFYIKKGYFPEALFSHYGGLAYLSDEERQVLVDGAVPLTSGQRLDLKQLLSRCEQGGFDSKIGRRTLLRLKYDPDSAKEWQRVLKEGLSDEDLGGCDWFS